MRTQVAGDSRGRTLACQWRLTSLAFRRAVGRSSRSCRFPPRRRRISPAWTSSSKSSVRSIWASSSRTAALAITSRKALNRLHEIIRKRLEQPIILTWSEHDSLDDVIAQVRLSTAGSDFPNGLPIVLRLQRPGSAGDRFVLPEPTAHELPIGEQLTRILEPIGLRYDLSNGAVIIGDENDTDKSM